MLSIASFDSDENNKELMYIQYITDSLCFYYTPFIGENQVILHTYASRLCTVVNDKLQKTQKIKTQARGDQKRWI